MSEQLQPQQSMNAADEIIGRPLAQGLGEQTAVLCAERSITYRELDAATNRHGNALRAHGVGKGDRVLFLMDDSPELVAAYLGTLRIGAVAVALNVRLAPRDVLYVIQDSACRLLYIDAEFLHLYQQIAGELEQPPQVIVRGDEAPAPAIAFEHFLDGQAATLESVQVAPDDVAYWLYSSGTTGRPKAVMHAHRSVLIADRLEREYFGIQPGDRVFTTSKMFFGWSLGHSLMGGLQCGATVIVAPGWPDAERVIATAARHRPTILFSTPVMYRNLLREGAGESAAMRDIRHFVSAGEKLPENIGQQWLDTFGIPITEGIGASETVFLFLCAHPDAHRIGSCGKRVPWAEVRLLDELGNEITTPDTPGLIAIRMASQFVGYWKLPETTDKALRDGWYYPGDMFSFDADGFWYHNGRADDMLKISGQWVSPGEIESCASAVPGIAEAVVVAVPNDDGLTRLTLFVVPEDPSASQQKLSEAVMATLRGTLSIYKCPRTIQFLEELPRTATGKVQKYRLREMLQAAA